MAKLPKESDKAGYELGRFVRLLLLFAIPFVLLIALYLVADPFKVIRQYDDYYPERVAGGVSLNPGHVATQTYLHQASSRQYDSFVMGNSRSIYYPVSTWQSFLPSGSSCFHYDAAAESILGIWQKLSFVERQGGKIRNLLMVADAGLLAKTDCDHWHLCETPPILTGYRNLVSFHWYNLKTFITPKFLAAYTDYSIFGVVRPYMLAESLLTEDMFLYDRETNECNFEPLERQISNGQYFNQQRIRAFDGSQYPDSVSPSVIGDEQQVILDSIASLLLRHNTSLHIVISPLYNQIRFNPSDRKWLEDKFGTDHVHDFSGPNEWNADYRNYYETSHYRPHVANAILEQIYRTADFPSPK